MRCLTLCFVLAFVATPAAALSPNRSKATDGVNALERKIESDAAKAQVGEDAFQSHILAAERRATASICAGCFATGAAPAARPVVHAHARAKPLPSLNKAEDDVPDDLR